MARSGVRVRLRRMAWRGMRRTQVGTLASPWYWMAYWGPCMVVYDAVIDAAAAAGFRLRRAAQVVDRGNREPVTT